MIFMRNEQYYEFLEGSIEGTEKNHLGKLHLDHPQLIDAIMNGRVFRIEVNKAKTHFILTELDTEERDVLEELRDGDRVLKELDDAKER